MGFASVTIAIHPPVTLPCHAPTNRVALSCSSPLTTWCAGWLAFAAFAMLDDHGAREKRAPRQTSLHISRPFPPRLLQYASSAGSERRRRGVGALGCRYSTVPCNGAGRMRRTHKATTTQVSHTASDSSGPRRPSDGSIHISAWAVCHAPCYMEDWAPEAVRSSASG